MIAFALAAALPEAAPMMPTGKWSVEYAKNMCVLSRDYGDPSAKVTLALRPYPMGTSTEVVLLTPKEAPQVYQGKATLQLLPAGQPAQGSYSRYKLPSTAGRLSTLTFGPDALAGITAANAITLSLGSKERYTFALPAIQAGVRALTTCQADLLANWGIGSVEQKAVATPPKANLVALFGPDNYPSEAQRAGQQGLVIAVAAVDDRGVVRDCAVASTSGSAALDAATCNLLRRGRFAPALGNDGKPLAAHVVVPVRWVLPT